MPGLASLSFKYLGTPYKLGGRNIDEGLDCLSFVLSLANELKVEIPESFEGIDRANYEELWQTDPEKAKKIFIRFVSSLGKVIPAEKAFATDLLIITPKKGNIQVGMHAGGDCILSAFIDKGIALASLRAFKIIKAIRWFNKDKKNG